MIKEIINKIGIDKFAHYGIGGVICAFIVLSIHLPVYIAFAIATVFVIAISIYKELVIDKKADWLDVVAAVLGCLTILLGIWLGTI